MPQADQKARDEMPFGALISWAWTETAPVHRNRTNLLFHIVAVPLFIAAHALLFAAFFTKWWLVAPAVLCAVASLALQKFGHSLEQQSTIPFASRRDFVRRLYAEQFINFWRFLFSGNWYASFRSAGDATASVNRSDA